MIVSFDGAADNRLWQKSREIAKRTGARFTYFLSCTHLIERAARDSYKGPGIKTGRSNVGFAPTAEDAATRLHHIWQAHLEGHEIANHGCGHFDGKDWTSADWLQEFESFDRVLKNAWKANGVADQEPQGWADLVDKGISGFRAPYLSQSPALATAQRVKGFAYDASQVVRGPVPVDTSGKIASFGLPLIPEGPKTVRSSPWTTTCSSAIPSLSKTPRAARNSKPAAMTPSVRRSIGNMRAHASRFNSAFTSWK